MITAPRRAVTRFFIPLIDVLILLFCMFLLLPFVSAPTKPESEEVKPPPPPELPTDVKELQRQLAEARLRLERLERLRAKLADRLSVRVLQLDPSKKTKEGVPVLVYYDPDRLEVDSEAAALALINKQKRIAGYKDIFFLILYPPASGYPREDPDDRAVYRQWFRDVPLGFDIGV